MRHARQGQAEGGAAPVLWLQFAGLTLRLIELLLAGLVGASSGLLAQWQGLHQHRQLVFQPTSQPGGQGILWADLPGTGGQGPGHRQSGFAEAGQAAAGVVIQFRQALQQLLQGVAHLPAFLL